jgi:hypothetical protein
VALVGILTSAITLSPYSINLQSKSVLAKSESKELLFASRNNLENLDFWSDNGAFDNVKQALKDKKIIIKSIHPEEKEDVSEFNSIAYNYKDVKGDKKLQESLQTALSDGKKVFLYGGLTVEEYCELLGIENIYSKIESSDSKETIKVSFHDSKKEKKKLEEKEGSYNISDNIHEIIGYTLDKDASYKVFISDINNYDDKGKIDLTDEIYLKEILEHENKDIEKSNMSLASAKIVDSEYDIIANAYYLNDKVGSINSQWKLYKVTDESDSDYDFFYVKDTSTIETYSWSWDAERFSVKHDLPFDGDQLDDASPNDTSSNPYSISLSFPFNISYTYTLDSEPDIDLTLNKTYDYAKWIVRDNQLESDQYDYEFVTAWASTGSYAAIDIDHTVNFYSGIDVEADADHSITVRYDY